jgi:hypothetical protein
MKKFLKLFVRRQECWSIGIYSADEHLNLQPLAGVKNPVLTAKDVTDLKADFVADPFLIHKDGIWHMFFEALRSVDERGIICWATSPDSHHWTYQQIVLEEPFHLSYPYVFEWNHEYYMVPETYQAQEVRIYKAIDFPKRWQFEKTLLSGSEYVDSSLFHHNGLWWMFSSTTANDVLRLYYTDNLLGEWIEHPKSPVIKHNPHLARPAGRVINSGGRLIRFAQDDEPYYGRQVHAFEILELTRENYVERELANGKPVLAPSGFGWNATGMHHVDLQQIKPDLWLACVDAKRVAIQLFRFPAG